MVELRYFAWVRERIGKASERYEGEAQTLHALLDELEARGEGYGAALQDRSLILAAIDQELAQGDVSLEGAREIALFPPMTGG